MTAILPYLQVILTLMNICILGFAFFKFLGKPHATLEGRIPTLEVDMKEIKHSLLQGNDRFRDQEDTNQVLIHSVLALIEFEMQYCLIEHKEMSEGLRKAKNDLNDFLAKK